MILIVGGAVSLDELPYNEIVDYKILDEFKLMQVEMLAKQEKCELVYLHIQYADTLSDSIDHKVMTFSNKLDLIDMLNEGEGKKTVQAPIIETIFEPKPQPQEGYEETPQVFVQEETPEVVVEPLLASVSALESSVVDEEAVAENTDVVQPVSEPSTVEQQSPVEVTPSHAFDGIPQDLAVFEEPQEEKQGVRIGSFILDTSVTVQERVKSTHELELEKRNEILQKQVSELQGELSTLQIHLENKEKVFENMRQQQRIASETTIHEANKKIVSLNNLIKELEKELSANPIRIYGNNPQSKIVAIKEHTLPDNLHYFAMGDHDSATVYYSSIAARMRSQQGSIYIDLTCNRVLAKAFKSANSNSIMYLVGGDIRATGQEINGNIFVASAYMNDVALLNLPLNEILSKVREVYKDAPIILLLGSTASFVTNSLIVEATYGGAKGTVIVSNNVESLLSLTQYMRFLHCEMPKVYITYYEDHLREVVESMTKTLQCTAFKSTVNWESVGLG